MSPDTTPPTTPGTPPVDGTPPIDRVGLRALPALTASVLVRLLREGMVRRALAFPVVLIVATLLGTILVVVALRGAPLVVADRAEPAAVSALVDAGFVVLPWPDVEGPVRTGLVTAGLGPDGLVVGPGRLGAQAEAAYRRAAGSPWVPESPPPPPLPGPDQTAQSGRTISVLLMSIFSLYGVVFGAGLTARDRDDGTLALELSLATPRWVHGAARWLAGTVVLGVWVVLGVAFTAALLGLPDPAAALSDGLAAAAGSVALGLASVGRASLKTGFAASLALGLTGTTALLGLGAAWPGGGQFLPLASVAAGGFGAVPLVVSLLLGVAAVATFTFRSARA